MYVEPDGTLNMEANTDTSDDTFYSFSPILTAIGRLSEVSLNKS